MTSERDGSDVRLAEVMAALSMATDIGMGMTVEYALRSCLLALRLAEALGFDADEQRDTYYLALLRWIGCTTEAHIAGAVFGDEIAARREWLGAADKLPLPMLAAAIRHHQADQPPLRRARAVASAFLNMRRLMNTTAAHCEVAERLAERMSLPRSIQVGLLQAYERWDGKGEPRRLPGPQIAPAMRAVCVVQDALIHHRLGGNEAAVAVVRDRAGHALDPEMAERFCQEGPDWIGALDDGSLWQMALDAEPLPRLRLDGSQLDAALQAIGDFVDLKSPWLSGHSSGVADLTAEAARRAGLPESDVATVRRAGYIHDLGRVGVSSSVWGKEGRLTDGEWEQVRLHCYYGERIFARATALAPAARIAALHHERLDGGGYHKGLPAALLPLTARLLAAADVYHALTEPRPHRPAREPAAAAAELRAELAAGRLAGDAVNAVLAAAGHRVRGERHPWPAGLSEREVEVLRLLARGLATREIAQRLTISAKTADHHIQHIYGKLAVSTRPAATVFAMQHGLLDDAGLLPVV